MILLLATGSIMARKHSEKRDRENTARQFTMIFNGLSNWEDQFGSLPPSEFNVGNYTQSGWTWNLHDTTKDQKALYSWRFPLLVYGLFYGAGSSGPKLWPRFDESWMSEANQLVIPSGEKVYCNPESSDTCIFAVVGHKAAFGTKKSHRLKDLSHNTIILVEMNNSSTKWPEPKDFVAEEELIMMDSIEKEWPSSRHGNGFHVAFADGEVWFLDAATPRSLLLKFFDATLSREMDRNRDLKHFHIQ